MIKRICRYLRRHIVLYCVNTIFSGTNPNFFEIKRLLLNSIGYNIGVGTKIVGPIISSATIVIGEYCWIGTNFCVRGNGFVYIGDKCDVGPDVTFLTGSHEIGGAERRAGAGFNYQIRVGNGNWIGGKSVFLNQIEIGNSNVIAACTCVCKSFSNNSLIGGIPSKIIKYLGE